MTHLLFPIHAEGASVSMAVQISPAWMAPHSYKLEDVVLTLKIREEEEAKPACVYYVDVAQSSHLIFAWTPRGR